MMLSKKRTLVLREEDTAKIPTLLTSYVEPLTPSSFLPLLRYDGPWPEPEIECLDVEPEETLYSEVDSGKIVEIEEPVKKKLKDVEENLKAQAGPLLRLTASISAPGGEWEHSFTRMSSPAPEDNNSSPLPVPDKEIGTSVTATAPQATITPPNSFTFGHTPPSSAPAISTTQTEAWQSPMSASSGAPSGIHAWTTATPTSPSSPGAVRRVRTAPSPLPAGACAPPPYYAANAGGHPHATWLAPDMRYMPQATHPVLMCDARPLSPRPAYMGAFSTSQHIAGHMAVPAGIALGPSQPGFPPLPGMLPQVIRVPVAERPFGMHPASSHAPPLMSHFPAGVSHPSTRPPPSMPTPGSGKAAAKIESVGIDVTDALAAIASMNGVPSSTAKPRTSPTFPLAQKSYLPPVPQTNVSPYILAMFKAQQGGVVPRKQTDTTPKDPTGPSSKAEAQPNRARQGQDQRPPAGGSLVDVKNSRLCSPSRKSVDNRPRGLAPASPVASSQPDANDWVNSFLTLDEPS